MKGETKMKYLKNIKTLEDLKKEYHKWAMDLHPDRGGDVEAMKILNFEYDEIFERVKDIHTNAKGEKYEKETNEKPGAFQNLINELMKINNIRIEIIGCFIWISGNTKPHRETLKSFGFKWHYKKRMWYLSPSGYRRFGKKNYTMNQIREMYGVQYDEKVHLKEIPVSN